ncbi:MAG: hypothetical protein HYY29_04585, partial [Chloroflexi bacterium]|nr:hypothetical protein [Chloroflexota bacterium]
MSHKHPGLLITLAVMGLFAFSACFLKRPAPATELRRIEPYPSDAPAQIVLTPPLPAPNGGTPAPAPADNSLPTLAVVPVKAYAYPPSHMDIIFSLRDQNGRAEVAPSDMLKVRIFENGQEVDYSETAYFVDQAENLELEVVFVLDFTKSMKDSGAIPLMIEGAKAVVERLGEAHRIAVVEYHDRNQEPAVLQGLTTYKPSLSAAIDEFQEQGYLSGASSGWDAVY